MNAPNMANLEFDPHIHRTLLDYFQWLVDIGVEGYMFQTRISWKYSSSSFLRSR